jgi:hypothetical protein
VTTDPQTRLAELRAAMSLLAGAAADLDWGAQPEVRVLPDGRLWLADLQLSVSAVEVYQAARGLVAAQVLAALADGPGTVADLVGPWLTELHLTEALLTVPGERDEAA